MTCTVTQIVPCQVYTLWNGDRGLTCFYGRMERRDWHPKYAPSLAFLSGATRVPCGQLGRLRRHGDILSPQYVEYDICHCGVERESARPGLCDTCRLVVEEMFSDGSAER